MHNKVIKSIVGELDLHRLQKKLDGAGYGPVPVALGDLFACGCYFIRQGKTELGFKLFRTALLVYGVEPGAVERIIGRIEGREAEFSMLLNLHLEIYRDPNVADITRRFYNSYGWNIMGVNTGKDTC